MDEYDSVVLMREALEAYEVWEGRLLTTDEAWPSNRDTPVFTEDLFEELLKCQALRNKALGKETIGEG